MDSYAMALGAAPANGTNGPPADAAEENMPTSGATAKYSAITRATGREIAMAASFMMKFVRTGTNNAFPCTKSNQWAL